METRKTQLLPDSYYHIYNRGINGQNIFLEDNNYEYFLNKYSQHVLEWFGGTKNYLKFHSQYIDIEGIKI